MPNERKHHVVLNRPRSQAGLLDPYLQEYHSPFLWYPLKYFNLQLSLQLSLERDLIPGNISEKIEELIYAQTTKQ